KSDIMIAYNKLVDDEIRSEAALRKEVAEEKAKKHYESKKKQMMPKGNVESESSNSEETEKVEKNEDTMSMAESTIRDNNKPSPKENWEVKSSNRRKL